MKPKPTKLFGTYPQVQDDLYMQRIPIFAGHITAHQLDVLARIAIEYTNSTPLHLTTRQDIELHNVPASGLQAVLDELGAVGFSTYGAGGDNLRNITVCPCCQYDASALDVMPLAQQLKNYLQSHPVRQDMPRKFKISFAGCSHPQTRPYINDLSFIATSAATLQVVGAGSLGAKPEPGIILYEQISADDVIPLTIAAIELFKEQGDRQNRRKARLRHIRQRIGNRPFLELLNDYFKRQKKKGFWPQIGLFHGRTGFQKAATIQTIAGDIAPRHAQQLAQAAHDADAHLYINFHHGIDIYTSQAFELPNELRVFADLPAIAACPGNTTCTNGLTHCPALAAELSQLLKGNRKYYNKTIAISGCPNNCAQSAIANIGLVGRIKTIDGVRQEVYQLMLNGDNGISATLADPADMIPVKEIPKHFLK